MRNRPSRVIFGLIGLAVGLVCIDFYERNRAVGAPDGWKHTSSKALPVPRTTPRIGTSVWRMVPGTVWTSETRADQMYVRATLEEKAVLELGFSGSESQELWATIGPGGVVQVTHGGTPHKCMGAIDPLVGVTPIELERGVDGLTVRVENQRMVCPLESLGETPRLRVHNAPVDIVSVGRDRATDGVPVSPLWWMSALMGIGFVWMLLLDVVLGIVRRLRGIELPD